MKLKLLISAALLTSAVQLSSTAFADDPSDSSANAAAGFLQDVQESRALVLRVPINERGEENTNMASARIYKGDQDFRGADIMTAWDQGTSIDNQPRMESDSPTDSSTWGWYNYRYNRGWTYPYYYYNYQPYAYYYGNSYYYPSTYYYNNWYGGSYGYRYYYYCY